MQSIEFRPAQRRKLLTWGWVCVGVVLIGVAGVVAQVVFLPDVGIGLLGLPGLVGLLLAPLTLGAGYGHTVLSPDGIRTSRLLRRHSCTWPEVTGIDSVETRGGRGPAETWIRVTRASGTSFKLAAPFDSGNGRDPELADKLGQIREYWADARRLAGSAQAS